MKIASTSINPNKSHIRERLVKGVFWSILGLLISRGTVVISTLFVARILGKVGYGELGIIQSTIGMFGVFAAFGLGTTVTKFVAEFRDNDPERAGRIVSISFLFSALIGGTVAIVLVTFADILATYTLNASHLSHVLRLSAISLFLSAINGTQNGVLSGLERFKTISKINLQIALISLPITIFLAYAWGVDGAVWALNLNLALTVVLTHFFLKAEIDKNNILISFGGLFEERSLLWKFSLPATLSGLLVAPVNWASAAMLVNRPEGYSEMGIYNVANQWRLAVLFIPGVLGQVLLPMLSSSNDGTDRKQYKDLLKLSMLINICIALAIVIPLCLLSDLIMGAYGKEYLSGAVVMQVLGLSAVLVAVNNVVGQAIVSKGRVWIGLIFNMLWAVSLLSMNYIFLNLGYGALGLALSTLFAYFLHSLWQGVYMYNVLKM